MHSLNKQLGPKLEHLRPLFESGDLVLLPVSLSQQMDAHLQKLPWIGQSIDLEQLKSAKKIPASDLEMVVEKLRETEFGRHSCALAFFKGDDLVVGGKLSTIMENIDSIFWRTPGTRFVFGADTEAAKWAPALDDFIQYDGGDFLMVSR
jgi:hypothetical protein